MVLPIEPSFPDVSGALANAVGPLALLALVTFGGLHVPDVRVTRSGVRAAAGTAAAVLFLGLTTSKASLAPRANVRGSFFVVNFCRPGADSWPGAQVTRRDGGSRKTGGVVVPSGTGRLLTTDAQRKHPPFIDERGVFLHLTQA
jgi:hypothetical protein